MSGFADFQINEDLIRRAEDCLIEDARRQSMLAPSEETTVEFMAKLQHYGGVTRLLDVSRDPLVAFYFSLGCMDETGVIFRYFISPECVITGENGVTLWRDLLNWGERNHPILYIPPSWGRRIEVQSGAFLTTSLLGQLSDPNIFTNEARDSKVDLVWVAPDLKKEAMAYLERKGITKQTLLPSLQSFAESHSWRVPLKLA